LGTFTFTHHNPHGVRPAIINQEDDCVRSGLSIDKDLPDAP
jgi:hypothetical protein